MENPKPRRLVDALKVFDAGDVQANGFQVNADATPFETVTESGASYMGFAASSLLASAAADAPRYMIAFSGDGSFLMNPQILVDAVAHGVRGMVIVFDNRRMGAISSLQQAQYRHVFGTGDGVAVDFVALANAVAGVKGVFGGFDAAAFERALKEAHDHDGLSVVHVPVYWGEEPSGRHGRLWAMERRPVGRDGRRALRLIRSSDRRRKASLHVRVLWPVHRRRVARRALRRLVGRRRPGDGRMHRLDPACRAPRISTTPWRRPRARSAPGRPLRGGSAPALLRAVADIVAPPS